MRILELNPDQLPLVIKLKAKEQTTEYVLVKTKQDKLLINKPNAGGHAHP
jgi:hypothetical protein